MQQVLRLFHGEDDVYDHDDVHNEDDYGNEDAYIYIELSNGNLCDVM